MMWRQLRDSRGLRQRRMLQRVNQARLRAERSRVRAELHAQFLEGFISAMIERVRVLTGVTLRPAGIRLRDPKGQ
jgi:hypothetical protein